MRNSFIVAIVMLILGTAVGRLSNYFLDAGSPGVEIVDLKLKENSPDVDNQINITEEVVRMSRLSNWTDSLSPSEPTSVVLKFRQNLSNFISINEKIDSFLPRYKQFIENNKDETIDNIIFKQRINDFWRSNSSELDAFIASIEGEIGRGAIDFKVSELTERATENDSLRLYTRESRVIALGELVTGVGGWKPEILLKMIDHIENQNRDEYLLHQKLLGHVDALIASSSIDKKSRSISITVVLSNYGSDTITFDNIGLLEPISMDPILLSSKEGGVVIVKGGESAIMEYDQFGYLSDAEFKKLDALFGNKDFSATFISKIIAGNTGRFTKKSWIRSPVAQLGGNIELRKSEYLEQRAKQAK